MPCLAFEFFKTNHGLEDPYSISRANPMPQNCHKSMALRAAKQISKMKNLDDLMNSNSSLKNRYVEETKRYLSEAGYTDDALKVL